MNNREARSSRHILLSQRGNQFRATPAKSSNPFPAFAFPHLPLFLVSQLTALGERFWTERRACIAAVLMLDRLTLTWLPVLPTQSCGRKSVRFHLRQQDFRDLPPHLLIAGSFQTQASTTLFGAAKAVPGWDGVHLVASVGKWAVGDGFVFLRHSGEVHLADPDGVLADDLKLMLRRYADRLRTPGPHL